jgi:hypothetical protein
LAANNIVQQETTFTTQLESRTIFPRDLLTVFLDLSVGWRHYFSDAWDSILGAGLNVRAREVMDPISQRTWFQSGVGPLGRAALRYRIPRKLTLMLEYTHRYTVTHEIATAASADTDQVGLAVQWIISRSWLFDLASTFRYMRAPSPLSDLGVSTGKVLRARTSITFLIRPGLSVDLGYDFELVRDRPALSQTGQPGFGLITDYTKHLVGLGFSIAWPPAPEQDTRLTRRASENEPVFELGPHGASSPLLRDADEVMDERRAERERRRRARELGQEEPLQPEPPLGRGLEEDLLR